MERENVFFISIFLLTFYCSFLDSTSVPRLKFQRLQFTLQFLYEKYVTSIIFKLEATEDGLVCTLTKTDFEGHVCELLIRLTTLHSTWQDGQTSKPACSLYLPFYSIRVLFIYQKIPKVFVVPEENFREQTEHLKRQSCFCPTECSKAIRFPFLQTHPPSVCYQFPAFAAIFQ